MSEETKIEFGKEMFLDGNNVAVFFPNPSIDPNQEGRIFLLVNKFVLKDKTQAKIDSLSKEEILDLLKDGIKFRDLKKANLIKKEFI